MKKFLFISFAALALMFAGCSGSDDDNPDDSTVSLEGRWNAPRHSDAPDDYALSLIFKGNKLDVYIISYGWHLEGTYTYVDNYVNYNITKGYNVFAGVKFDDEGNMISYHWEAGNMDQETFALTPGYEWYEMDGVNLEDSKENLSKFNFKVKGDTATTSSVFFEIEGFVFHKAK